MNRSYERSRSRSRRAVAGAVAVFLLATTPLVAQKPEDEAAPEEVFFEQVEVQVVNVDVYVTDKKTGERVRGLTKDDFEILEDGRPVPISNFLAIEDGRAAGMPPTESAEIEAIEDLDELPDLRLQRAVVPPEQQLHLIVYFDNLFMKVFSRNRVIRETRNFIQKRLRKGDRVMIVSFERALHVRQPFTTDYAAISDALTELETEQGWAQQAETARREVIRNMELARDSSEALSRLELYVDSVHHDVGRSIDKLREVVSSLAGLPGRKAILHVSDGIPIQPGADLFLMLANKSQNSISLLASGNRYRLHNRYRSLTALAASNRVSFYTMEAAGLRSHRSLSAEYGGQSSGSQPGASYIEMDTVDMANRQETLQILAHDTGGLAAFNTNNIGGALDRMEQDFENWYSLAYTPARSGDGRYHDIEVRMKRKGLEVRHRTGYRDKSLETRVNESTLASLFYGLSRNDLEVEVALGRPLKTEDEYLVGVDVKIPIGNLVLLPHEKVARGRVRVSLAAQDQDGRVSEVDQQMVPLEIPLADLEMAKTKHFTYSAQLLMRKGQQTVAVGVQDDYSKERSMVREHLRVGG